jgi:hypothetical protein
VQTASAQAGEILASAPLDDGNVDPRLRQLARQHQPRWTSSGYHYCMLGHRHTPAGITPVATNASHPSATAATVPNLPAAAGDDDRSIGQVHELILISVGSGAVADAPREASRVPSVSMPEYTTALLPPE